MPLEKLVMQGIKATQQAKDGKQDSPDIEKYQGVKVQDDIFHLQAPEKILQEEPGNADNVGVVLDARSLEPVACRVRNVNHTKTHHVELNENVVAIPVPRIDVVQADMLERTFRDGGIPVLRVHHLPVAAGNLREHGKDGVPGKTPPAHPFPEIGVNQAVSHGIVTLVANDGTEKIG